MTMPERMAELVGERSASNRRDVGPITLDVIATNGAMDDDAPEEPWPSCEPPRTGDLQVAPPAPLPPASGPLQPPAWRRPLETRGVCGQKPVRTPD